jgi:hypothetical protein
MGVLYLSAAGDRNNARIWLNKIKEVNVKYYIFLFFITLIPSIIIRKAIELKKGKPKTNE